MMVRKSIPERLLELAVARAKLVEELEEVLRWDKEIARLRKYHANDTRIKRKVEVKLNKMVRSNKSRAWRACSRYDTVRYGFGMYTATVTYRIPTAIEIFAELKEEKANANKEKTEPLYPQRVPDAGGF